MLSRLLREHQAKQSERKELQEKRRREAIAAATCLTEALVDHLNVGPREQLAGKRWHSWRGRGQNRRQELWHSQAVCSLPSGAPETPPPPPRQSYVPMPVTAEDLGRSKDYCLLTLRDPEEC
ncbi:biogenesis of lysosome-related organelles complex 1 subunit 1 isoform X3 [Canis lupus baileyi]|uniref:biogenesis of lysosome-related organelles complex 1 subunit 1 isoform X3 n=1 Tax=Canis lupus baileyi TaxID=143281 RepID=UPI003B976437